MFQNPTGGSRADAQVPGTPEFVERFRRALLNDLGPVLRPGVEDADVNEILVNADGRVFFDHESAGLEERSGIDPGQADALARTVASFHGLSFDQDHPSLEAALPFDGSRFTACRPPLTRAGVAITIRFRSRLRRLEPDFIETGILDPPHANLLRQALSERRNIVVCGGLGTGKSALANALILSIEDGSRIAVLEDVPEIECPGLNVVHLYSCPTHDLETLAGRTCLRLRIDRICLGEIRDREAVALLQAWTSIRGGIATLHADSAEGALQRLELLIRLARSAVANIARHLIAESVDFVAFMQGRGRQRRVASILEIRGYDEPRGQFDFTLHKRRTL